ncbi:unnamed protein product [Clonostachys byssicola]|uniref:Uncharacterized protein n=1 Tax=Clonostachys byssicola TaxID=160290 RepID=A0A9N9ULN4_9HYPO|nr:unnamed protein product [Clonostachys byssicola]
MELIYETANSDTQVGGQKPSSLTDLPIDILVYLLDNFLHLEEWRKDKLNWDEPWGVHAATEGLQTIQNLRQVCRLFHDLVSPLLCRRLRIHLDPQSLDQARGILRNRAIASGVRGVRVAIPYRPKELALNLSSFVDVRLKQLAEPYHEIMSILDTRWMNGDPDDTQDEESFPRERKNYHDILFSWRPRETSTEDAADSGAFVYKTHKIEPAVRDEYKQILLQGHEIFRERYEAQQKLIETGLFVETIADLIRQIPNTVSLSLVDRFPPKSYRERKDISLLVNKEELLPFLTSPFNWSDLWTMPDPPQLIPARILTELPIAIHKSGRSLRHLHLGCIPVEHGFEQLDPGTDGFSWSQLREACQQLEVFDLKGPQMNLLPFRPESIPLPSRQFLVEFFGAILSSNKLQDVNLGLLCLGVNNGRDNDREWCPLGAIFRNISWPNIRKVRVSDIGFSQDELDQFCSGLGFGLEKLSLGSFQLRSGSWVDAIDMLHERVAVRHATPGFWCYFSGMIGGEFGGGKKTVDITRALMMGYIQDERTSRALTLQLLRIIVQEHLTK